MADNSDSDDDDLFLDFENSTCEDLNVSANLITDVGTSVVSQTSIDRVSNTTQDKSKAEWVAPAVTGLKNSHKATAFQSGKHWYRDDEFKNKPDSNKTGKVQWPAHASPELTSTAGVPGMIGSGGKPPQMMSFSPMAPGGVPQSS